VPTRSPLKPIACNSGICCPQSCESANRSALAAQPTPSDAGLAESPVHGALAQWAVRSTPDCGIRTRGELAGFAVYESDAGDFAFLRQCAVGRRRAEHPYLYECVNRPVKRVARRAGGVKYEWRVHMAAPGPQGSRWPAHLRVDIPSRNRPAQIAPARARIETSMLNACETPFAQRYTPTGLTIGVQ